MIEGVEYLQRPKWQMTPGERSALEGLLSNLRPSLSVEVGTAEGGSLRTVAAYSGEVHSFDLVTPETDAAQLANVTIHTGDSHKQLPDFLQEMTDAEHAVDFLLIDGDHTTEGVRLDAVDAMSAGCASRSVIIFHDTANDVVRAGLEAVDWDGYDDLAYLDLDFVAGYAVTDGPYAGHCWGGLGIVVRDAERVKRSGRTPRQPFLPAPEALWAWQAAAAAAAAPPAPEESAVPDPEIEQLRGQIERLRGENAQRQHWLDAIQSSPSWRLTGPLRAAKRAVKNRRNS